MNNQSSPSINADLTAVTPQSARGDAADNGRTGIDESPAVSSQPAGNGMISSNYYVFIDHYILIVINLFHLDDLQPFDDFEEVDGVVIESVPDAPIQDPVEDENVNFLDQNDREFVRSLAVDMAGIETVVQTEGASAAEFEQRTRLSEFLAAAASLDRPVTARYCHAKSHISIELEFK